MCPLGVLDKEAFFIISGSWEEFREEVSEVQLLAKGQCVSVVFSTVMLEPTLPQASAVCNVK